MSVPATNSLLDQINDPAQLRPLSRAQLKILAGELRRELVDVVSVTGGHLGAGLGVVELTVALHHVFDAPRDKLIWDVGHQAYPHKILTGRRVAFALVGHDVHQHGPLPRIADVLQDWDQMIEIVTVDGAHIIEAQLLE